MILNQTIETLMDRRSIRSYKPDAISEEELSRMVTAAEFAPSAMGRQDRHITVIQNTQLLKDISVAAEKSGRSFGPGYLPFYGAPIAVVFSAPRDSAYGREDTALAAMNLMNAAQSYGIGTCYLAMMNGGLNSPEILPQLQLPEGYIVTSCVAAGYASDAAPAPAPRREGDVNYLI